VGAAAAVNFLASFSTGGANTASVDATRRARLEQTFRELDARGEAQVELLWEGLGSIPGVRVYGPPPGANRTSTVSFTLAGHRAIEVSRSLAGRGFFLSHGNFYAMTVVERLGLAGDGLVRIGCAAYTTDDEVRSLVEAVAQLATG
jgi:selenocysteine lyase/cysteine desulfurase